MRVTQINLRGNSIRRIEGLQSLIFLNVLDLSSNSIEKIENLYRAV
jgi:Leucine-rich repeat (LRR) protein